MQNFAIKLATSLILLFTGAALVHASGVDDGFDPNANNPVRTIVQQRDGALLVGGQFSHIGGQTRNRVARLLADGSASAGFNPDVGGDGLQVVYALDEQPDHKVLIGGRFASIGGQTRANIARVTASGSLDTTFNPAVNGMVRAVVSKMLPDGLTGSIYLAGEFNKVNDEARQGIVRLHADGSVDTSYVPPAFNGEVRAIKMQKDGRLLVAGTFTTIDGFATEAPVARLNYDGSLDLSFSTQLSRSGQNGPLVVDLAVQADKKILIAGYFDEVGRQPRQHIARLHPDGQLDGNFVPSDSIQGIEALVLQADGRIVIAGTFFAPSPYRAISRLNPDGSNDNRFVSRYSVMGYGGAYALARQADGKYVIGGGFSEVGGYARSHIARLDERGAPDVDLIASLSDGPDASGKAVAVQADGKILLGGDVSTNANSRLTRLLADGQRDPGFSSSVNGAVNVIIAQPDEKIVIAGYFDNVGGYIARLNADGSTDNAFVANANGGVGAGALQRNGRIVLAGSFTKINGVPRSRLARLLPNGVPDLSFNPSITGSVFAVVIQPDGKVLIGGDFTKVSGQARAHVARLHANGTLDTSFEADVDDVVRSIAVDVDGRILIGGRFDAVGGIPRVGIARLQPDGSVDNTFAINGYVNSTVVYSLALMSDGEIIMAGDFATQTGSLAFVRRLRTNGVLDSTFDPGFVANSSVYSLVVQPDGKLLFTGNFDSVGVESRSVVARYAQTGSATESVRLMNRSDFAWLRDGSGPELAVAPAVLWSTTCCNREDFVPLPNGIMQRFAKSWVLADIPTAGEGTIWLRAVSVAGDGARAVIPIESPIIALELDGTPEPSDHIFANGFEVAVPN